ncbi:hypothetical protein Tco_0694613 [Tanacetum coccineum]
MPSHFHKKFRWGTVFATGRRSFIEPGTGLRMKRTNRRTRVPIGLYPCHIEEKMTIRRLGESQSWNRRQRVEGSLGTDGLQNILPHIVTQVTTNVNNANGENGNSGNNGCSYKTFTACNPKEYDEKGESKNDFKALLVEEFCPINEMEKLENEFWNHTMVGANHVAYTDRFHELAKLVPHLVTPESS